MRLDDHAGQSASALAALAADLGDPGCLQDVVRWAFAHAPPLSIVDVIIQDEFTHDVVLHYAAELHLVFDTT